MVRKPAAGHTVIAMWPDEVFDSAEVDQLGLAAKRIVEEQTAAGLGTGLLFRLAREATPSKMWVLANGNVVIGQDQLLLSVALSSADAQRLADMISTADAVTVRYDEMATLVVVGIRSVDNLIYGRCVTAKPLMVRNVGGS